jgi:hypothetical protein
MSMSNPNTPLTPSRLLHDVVSNASTILSISQMALFSDDISAELRRDFERIMETAHAIVANIEELGELLENEVEAAEENEE